MQRWPRRARGSTGASGAARGISGVGRLKTTTWRHSGRPALHSSTRRKRDTRRSSWASQGVAGMAVSAVVASGGDGGVRAGRTEEGESVRGRERESRTALGVAWHRPDESRRSQAGREGGGGRGV